MSSVRRAFSSTEAPWKAGGSWAPEDLARPTTAAAASKAALRTYFIAPPQTFVRHLLSRKCRSSGINSISLSSVAAVFGSENDDVLGANRHRHGLAGTQSTRRLDCAHLDTADCNDILLVETKK